MNSASNPYVPILVIGAIGFGFAAISVLAGALTVQNVTTERN